MGYSELLLAEILRFSLMAFVVLGVCLCAVRLVTQPLERVRLIQISLFALAGIFALSISGAVPQIELPLLPATESVDVPATSVQPVRVAEIQGEPHQPLTVSQVPQTTASSVADDATTDDATDEPAVRHTTAASGSDHPAFSSMIRNVFTIVLVIVSFANIVHLIVGFVAARRLVTTSTPLTKSAMDRVARIVSEFSPQPNVKFARSNAIDVPMVVGLLQPTVLLPEALAADDADLLELKHSLAHEWGHIELHDLVTWHLTSLCQPFLWVQPCYWILRRELRVAQDQLADQYATKHTRELATYATTLLRLSQARQKALPGALTMAAGRSNLYRRIEMLMNEKFHTVRVTRKPLMVLCTALFAVAGGLLASLQLTHAAASANSPADQPAEDSANVDVEKDNDHSKSVEHSGVVIDADTGKPVSGVTVTVTRMESRDWQELAVTESITDDNGKYTFTIPPDQLKERLLYIMFDIDHPDYARRHCGSYGYGMIVKNLENGEQPWFSELKMVRGEKVSGRLVDANQKPVAGAQIRCESAPKSGRDYDRRSSMSGVSDEDGRFEMVVTHDGDAKISVIPTDHNMKHIALGNKRGDIGDVNLTDGISIHGIVQDAAGNPMSGLWVNITPEEDRGEACYEMKRSAITGRDGRFRTRPLKPGKHLFEVELKATGALEKLKYANFHDTPPASMFVQRTFNISEDSVSEPLVLQAVPHVLISVRHFTPKGEVSSGHSPYVTGRFDGQHLWIHGGKRIGKGEFELMVPHGLEQAELRFMTNEHSGLMVQFEGGELTPQASYRFDRIEEDIDNIRVVKHSAAILKLDIVDESGVRIKEAGIFAHYALNEDPNDEMMMNNQIGWNREEGLFRLSSIVPDAPVSIRFDASGYKTQTHEYKLKAGERRTVTIKLAKEGDKKAAAALSAEQKL